MWSTTKECTHTHTIAFEHISRHTPLATIMARDGNGDIMFPATELKAKKALRSLVSAKIQGHPQGHARRFRHGPRSERAGPKRGARKWRKRNSGPRRLPQVAVLEMCPAADRLTTRDDRPRDPGQRHLSLERAHGEHVRPRAPMHPSWARRRARQPTRPLVNLEALEYVISILERARREVMLAPPGFHGIHLGQNEHASSPEEPCQRHRATRVAVHGANSRTC